MQYQSDRKQDSIVSICLFHKHERKTALTNIRINQINSEEEKQHGMFPQEQSSSEQRFFCRVHALIRHGVIG